MRAQRLATLLTAALLLGSGACVPYYAAVECINQEYCSAGRIASYVGPLDDASQVKEALTNTHYKQEIVVFSDSRIAEAAYVVDQFRRKGWAHVLPVLPTAEDCHRLHQLFVSYDKQYGHIAVEALGRGLGPASCGWYARPGPGEHLEFFWNTFGFFFVWQKFYTAARALALGYNVLCLDSDNVPLGDFYGYVKQPPLAAFNMIAQAEGFALLNSGFMYFQNASVSGPTVWAFYHFLERAVRWSEDGNALAAISPSLVGGGNSFRDYQDQNMFSDVLWSCMARHPQFMFLVNTWIPAEDEGWKRLGAAGKDEYRNKIGAEAGKAWSTQVHPLPPSLADRVWGDPDPRPEDPPRPPGAPANATLWSAKLWIPHTSNPWPFAVAPPFFSPPGNRTLAFRRSFADLGVSFVDPEDPAHAAAAAAAAPELLTLTGTSLEGHIHSGTWLQHQWFMSGRLGWWHRHLKPRYQQAVGHVHAGLMPSDPFLVKANPLIASGNWNWHLQAVLHHSHTRVFAATRDHPDAAFALARIVTYAPGVIHYNLTKPEFIRAAQQLARAAIALGSSVAWPTPHCSSDWVLLPKARALPKPIAHAIPWAHLDTSFQAMPFGESLEGLKCEWPAFMIDECLANEGGPGAMRALLGVEWEHLLSTRTAHTGAGAAAGAGGEAAPAAAHVLQIKPAPDPPPPALSSAFAPVSAAALLALNAPALLALPPWGAPVYLDRLVEVTELPADKEAQYQAFYKKCRALHYEEIPAGMKMQW
ncbi:hypothetical protein HYH03_012475 [Edaphochlamys debaryana]|uniref:Nucleotide-diphospho-sugar transferase domain-containing protein n=1 Tax=Edaphochlamys debaryana TaxID=47281 RepID=A0A835XSU7_9CHLO|nr:hypothetical protein HYH03_012475 [Edaphochlamys debaryana]|eukprot:KAG2489037.1 hypothetical protein HYH03_012475 [Edaphochlamys debaryana]